jgi:hypothetical protein
MSIIDPLHIIHIVAIEPKHITKTIVKADKGLIGAKINNVVAVIKHVITNIVAAASLSAFIVS